MTGPGVGTLATEDHAHTEGDGPLVMSGGESMPSAKITRQWADGTVLVTEVTSDLDSCDEVTAAVAALDGLAAPDAEQ